MVLSAFVLIAAESHAEEALPGGFLEFLGGMIEVEGDAGKTLLDPLDFEDPLDQEETTEAAGAQEIEAGSPDSAPVEEVLP